MNKKLLPFVLFVCLFVGCSHEGDPSTRPLSAEVNRIEVVPAERIAPMPHPRLPGTVEPTASATLASKVAGRIVQMEKRLGLEVEEGTPLIRLENQEAQARLDRARAALDQSLKDLERQQRLFKDGAATQEELDAIRTRHVMTDAQVREAEAQLGEHVIRAPFKGRIGRIHAETGEMILPGAAVLTLEKIGDYQVRFFLPERLLPTLSLGDKLSVTIDTVQGPAEAEVVEIAPKSDPMTHTILVKLKLDWDPTRRLPGGLFCRVSLPAIEQDTLIIPSIAIHRRGQLAMVFTESNGKAKMNLVRTGREFEPGLIEISAGLESGSKVVVRSESMLYDGQKVEIIR